MRNLSIQEAFSLSGSRLPLIQAFQGVCVDSRQVKPGTVFFALEGDRTDGHHFLGEAAAKGACAAIVSKRYSGDSYGMALLPVDNVLACLQEGAKALLARQPVKVVGVTGSVGKTTTKDFIATLLEGRFKVSKSPGNSNSQVGVPMTIWNQMTGDEDVLVLEMGMTHPGNLSQLIAIAPPSIAVITTVALVHAGNFSSLEEIVKAKGEILAHPKTAIGIIPHDIPHEDILRQIGSSKKQTFSMQSTNADFVLRAFHDYFTLFHGSEEIVMEKLPFLGQHNYHNFLAAAAVARNLGLSWSEVHKRAGELKLPNLRMQSIEKKGIHFVNDSYNACAVSVKAALKSLPAPQRGGRKIAVIGQMLELGAFSAQCHQEVGKCALDHVEEMFCLGAECRYIVEEWQAAGRPVSFYADRNALLEELKKALKPGDVVLVKGSRSNELWNIIEEY